MIQTSNKKHLAEEGVKQEEKKTILLQIPSLQQPVMWHDHPIHHSYFIHIK